MKSKEHASKQEKSMAARQLDPVRRLRWFKEARFGMFVHWGALLASGPHRVDRAQRADPARGVRAFGGPIPAWPSAHAEVVRAGQGRRHEIRGDDHQAPRRLLPVGHERDGLQLRAHRPSARPAGRIYRRLPRTRPVGGPVLFANGLAPPRRPALPRRHRLAAGRAGGGSIVRRRAADYGRRGARPLAPRPFQHRRSSA